MRRRMTIRFHAKSDQGNKGASLTSTFVLLWPYIWPAGRRDLKLRVGLAVALMLLSKLITIAIPYSFKWVTDSLTDKIHVNALPFGQVLAGAGALTVLYGALRILMAFTQQGRDALFASVAVKVTEELPPWVGVPESRPVLASSVTPDGRVPSVTLQVYGGAPLRPVSTAA